MDADEVLSGLEYKGVSVSTPPAAVVTEGSEQGVVEALVAVTGVRDNVNDVIMPGAFTKTLGLRKPKGVFSHDTTVWVARTETVEELMPGDPRLLEMTTKAGRPPLPREAGALYVKARFNLRDDDARKAYEKVRFFSETGECEWSIGYQVPDGGARKDRQGTRYIKELHLFEYSPVLFGANSQSMTLSVKSGVPGVADTPQDRRGVRNLRRWYTHGEGAVQIAWGTPGDFARCVALASKHMSEEHAKGFCNLRHQDALGVPPGQEHGGKHGRKSAWAELLESKAEPGLEDSGGDDPWGDLLDPPSGGDATEDAADAADQDGGQDPDDTGDDDPGTMIALMIPPEIGADLAVPDGLPVEELHITLAYLGKGLDEGTLSDAAVVAEQVAAEFGTLAGTVGGVGAFPPGDDGVPMFATVDVPGLEVLRQRLVDALTEAGVPVMSNHGYTPHVTLRYAQPGDELPDPADPIEVEFATITLATDNDDQQEFPLMGGDGGAAEPAPAPAPAAGPVEMKGDIRIDMLRAAGVPIPMSYEEVRSKVREALCDLFRAQGDKKTYIDVEATFPEMVLFGAINHENDDRRAFQVPYRIGSDGAVMLGAPVPIDHAGAPVEVAIPRAVDEVAYLMKDLLSGVGELETKAGKMLSGSNAKKLRAAVLSLLDILKRAGIDLSSAVEKPEWPKQHDDADLLQDPPIMPDSTAPSALPSEMKSISAEEWAAGLDIVAAAMTP
ncbi:2'-5' RNA ligase family protein (plasmid) [Microtetraspora malaysiensis]|uniref:2'-5' RNA ligase family protein n=1 Tax=Microtetraspora malaysiensis TaxID=161358 RepID=UPI003D8EF80C